MNLRIALLLLMSVSGAVALRAETLTGAPDNAPPEQHLAAWAPRVGHQHPLIVVVGENEGTVLADYVLPYAILQRSGVADVEALATGEGELLAPPLRFSPQSTIDAFDQRHAEGADYVFVPAVKDSKRDDPHLLAWLRAQADKGATLVSICNGSIVLANAGVLNGKSATGHFSTRALRESRYPRTHWISNRRYVVDGRVASSAGVTAAIPVSLAVLESIAGYDRAAEMARTLGVEDWDTRHNSDAFEIKLGDYLTGFANVVFRSDETIRIAAEPGVDEMVLALTAEAWSDTLRNTVMTVASGLSPVRTAGGLMLLPDRVETVEQQDATLHFAPQPVIQALDDTLNDIARRYGKRTARLVRLDLEYPDHP